MNRSFERFGSFAATLTGVLSIMYAVLFLFVTRVNEYAGTLGSWIVLGGTAFFAIAAYVALYQRLKDSESGLALYVLLLSVMASFTMLQHGGFEAIEIVRRGSVSTALGVPSQVDPAGLGTFAVVGVGTFLWGWMILRTNLLPRNLGYVGILNSVLLVVLFFATVLNSQTLILVSGGLTSVIVGPLWWIWVGRSLAAAKPTVISERALA